MAAPGAMRSGVLLTRVVVGAALAVVAIAAVWTGGLAFTALVTAAVLLMNAEWNVMHGIVRGRRLASLVALALSAVVQTRYGALDALIALAASAGAIGLFLRGYDRKRAAWVAAGLLYCGLPMVALLWLRQLPEGGAVVTWIFAVVWATDICAFFVGRAVGGAKLLPSISPNKTWAGVAGGVIGASLFTAVLGLAAHRLSTAGGISVAMLTAAALAVIAICGDLFESWLKRRAGVKDSGNLLPGHGGVMDRIDGLVPVAVVVALLGGVIPVLPS